MFHAEYAWLGGDVVDADVLIEVARERGIRIPMLGGEPGA